MAKRGQGSHAGEYETTVEVEGEEVEVTVDYRFTEGTPDVYYLSNGDPGYPGDPPEVEVVGVWRTGDKAKTDLWEKLPKEVQERLEEEACEKGSDGIASAYEDAMEAKADAAREREWDRDED